MRQLREFADEPIDNAKGNEVMLINRLRRNPSVLCFSTTVLVTSIESSFGKRFL